MVRLPDTLECWRLIPVGLDQGSVRANDHPANKLEMPRVPDRPPGLGNLPGPGCSLYPNSSCPPPSLLTSATLSPASLSVI